MAAVAAVAAMAAVAAVAAVGLCAVGQLQTHTARVMHLCAFFCSPTVSAVMFLFFEGSLFFSSSLVLVLFSPSFLFSLRLFPLFISSSLSFSAALPYVFQDELGYLC